jgi:two-component system cell cycle sensor histidine kinase PleC
MPNWHRSSQPGTDHETMRCVVDDQGRLVFITPAVGWSLGISSEKLVTKPVVSILNIISAHDSQHQSLDFDGLLSGFYEVALLRHERDPLLLQARIDRVDGPNNKKYTVIWLDPEGVMQRSKNKDFLKVAHDFTSFVIDHQQKAIEVKAEEKPDLGHISNSDGELRHFLNITNDLLGVYRRDGSFVRVNYAFNRVLGFSDAELKLFPFIDIVHPDDRISVQSSMTKMLQTLPDQDMRIDFESRVQCKDGSMKYIQWLHKTTGEHIYIVGRDMTELKKHEEELTRREQQLSEAQKIGRMGNWLWELDATAMEWSDQIYTIFGVDKETFRPTMDGVNSLILKRDLIKIYKTFKRAERHRQDYALEFRVRRPLGGVRYIHCEGRCKVDSKTGKVEALFGIMQDITENTLHEKALLEAKEAAENAYASKTRFLANMSHELRTPLNAIIGFSEMIQRQLLGPVGNARYLDYIGGIRESGEHLLNLINDILDMSKIEIGKYELHVEEFNIGKLIRLAVHMIESRAQDAQVRLITDNIPEDMHIVADRRAIMQVLLNLLSNAVKFTPAEGEIEISCVEELGGIVISVADTGIGIPKDKIDVVTMPFEQVDSALTRKHEGSGLGLAITKDLVELHGGTLEINSVLGQGTIVSVMLPERKSGVNPVKTNTHDVKTSEERVAEKMAVV